MEDDEDDKAEPATAEDEAKPATAEFEQGEPATAEFPIEQDEEQNESGEPATAEFPIKQDEEPERERETTGVDDHDATGVDNNDELESEDDKAKDGKAREMNDRYGPRTGPQILRRRRKPNEKYCAAIQPQDHSRLHATLEHYAMTQSPVKKGLEVYGDAGKVAVSSEMKQLQDMDVVEPKKSNMLTWEVKSKTLNYLMF